MALMTAVNYDVGANPQAMASGDLNGDGRTDLVTANYGSNSVSVLLGNSDGSFTAAGDFATGATPRSVAAGDFNNDGHPDIATADFGANAVSVLLGNGAGGLGAPSTVNVDNPSSVAVGDFNADGKLDLAVGGHISTYIPPWGGCGGYGYCYGGGGYWTNQPRVSVLLGTGNGGFTTQPPYDLQYFYYSSSDSTPLAVADLNGDNKLDVVAGQSATNVLLGDGDGTLQWPTIALDSTAIATADVNGDGKIDLLGASGGSVIVALGNGLGQFGAAQYFDAGVELSAVAAGDFNGDSIIDLVASDRFLNAVHVLMGTGAGPGTNAYRPPLTIPTGLQPSAIQMADFNGDGRRDVATANAGSADASVLLNDGNWPALSAPSLRIGDATVTEGNSGSVNAIFNVTLSTSSNQDVTVRYATVDYQWSSATAGTDYEAQTGQLIIPAGETSVTITVPVQGDRIAETTEYFGINLTDSDGAFLADKQGAGTIIDDEPRITIDYYGETLEGNTGTRAIDFKVRLSTASDLEVRVNYSTAEGDTEWWSSGAYYPPTAATSEVDFLAATGTLIFAPGEIEKTISVLVNGDRNAEPTEAFSVDLSNPIGADFNGAHAVGYILDDEPIAWLTGTTVMEGNTGTAEATFTAYLSSASDAPITVDYTVLNLGSATAGLDYQLAVGTITFAPGQTSKSFSVLVNGDKVAEYDEYFYVQLTGGSGAHADASAAATIIDDDAHISISDVSLREGKSGLTYFTFTVSLSVASSDQVTVQYQTEYWGQAESGSDYQAKSGTLVFAPGDTSKTITIAVYGDTRKEADEEFYIYLSGTMGNAVIYDAYGTGTILNDDGGGSKPRGRK